jgi:hypothetical protein
MPKKRLQINSENVPAADDFSLPSFTAAQLNCPIALDLGLCIGLITDNGSGIYSINTGWFSDPASQLVLLPMQAEPLIDLINQAYLAAQQAPIKTDDGQNWYAIGDTGLFLIVPPTPTGGTLANGSQVIALGWRADGYKSASVTADAAVKAPIVAVPNSGVAAFVLGQSSYPIVLELDVTTSDLAATEPNKIVLSGNFTFQAAPTFSIELFNTQGANPTTPTATYTSLDQMLADVSFASVVNLLLSVSDVTAFLGTKLGSSTGTLGGILSSPQLGFLNAPASAGAPYTLASLDPFANEPALQIAENLFFAALNVLATSTNPIIPFPAPAGDTSLYGIWIASDTAAKGGTDYGVRVVVPPITLIDGGESKPTLTLQLGEWLTGEATGKKNSWYYRANPSAAEPAPGITCYFINAVTTDGKTTINFTGVLELVSFGFNYAGTSKNPLISYGASPSGGSGSGTPSPSFTLGGFEARGYLSFDFTASSVLQGWGGALRVDNVGIPLGSPVNAGGSNNEVAASTLASGSSSNGADPQPSQPVNPTFSVAASYVNGSASPLFDIQLYQADGTAASPQSPVWFPVQKSFGPINLSKFGINWDNPNLALDLDVDGDLTLGPLQVVLDNLQIQMPAKTPLDPSSYGLGLDGLGVSLNGGAVSLSGSLLHSGDQYAGEATITAGDFTISAVGAFGTTDGATSLFIFGCLNTPLGGPPAFFVTGVSAGFGYNRQLLMPPQDQVTSFPLVAMAEPPPAGGQPYNLDQALAALIGGDGKPAYVPPMRGEYWVALGVNWTSFEIVKTTALLAVQFGKELEIDILGVTTLQLGADPDHPYVNLKLGIEATIKPDDGTALVTGILDSSSYVIDPACHVTGGFAFATWYGDNEHSGDFVLTIGGYHPSFKPPPWYPQVPRVGLNWNYSNNIVLAGDAFFALTPIAAMGGCEIDVTYTSGDLKAWLTAKAEALVQWKPFFFDFDISVSVGVSYKLDLLFTTVNFNVELGAGFEIWGPATGGYVYVDWYVISFSIPFGPSKQPPTLNNWGDFAALLPAPPAAPPPSAALVAELAAAAPPSNIALQALITGGNLTQNPDGSWNVRADGLAMTVRSPMPSTKFTFTAGMYQPPSLPGAPFGMWQMGVTGATVATTVAIAAKAGSGGAFNPNANWRVAVTSQGMPAAMWGSTAPALNPTTTPATTTTLDTGLAITAVPMVAVGPPPIPILNLEYTTISANENLPAPIPVPAASAQAISTATLPLVITYLTDGGASGLRQQVLDALAGFGYDTGFDTVTPPGLTWVSPSGLSNVYVEFRNEVMLGAPAGISWPTSPTP